MHSLQQTGLVGEVGVSSYTVERWRAAEGMLRGRILSNEVCYNLVDRSAERELLPFAELNGRIIIAFSPLAQGLLSGKYDATSRPGDKARASSGFFQPDNLAHTRGLIATLREVADAHSATLAQIALAWVIRSPVVAAIPGASSVEQLELNVAAAEIELSDDEYHALNTASAGFRPTAATNTRSASKIHRNLSAVKHSAKGGWYLAQTIWDDHTTDRDRRLKA
jgi:aryl-alcohol dehydrogenase-like predicted oxidoreductase